MISRVCKSPEHKVLNAVLTYNLKQERQCDSGSLENLNNKCRVEGGYIIKNSCELIGWGAAFSNGEFHVYVCPQARNKGAASKVIKRAIKDWPNHKFCPWDKKTKDFFKNRNANIVYKYL